MNQRELRGRDCTYYRSFKKVETKAMVIQPNHQVAGWIWCPCLVSCHVGVDDVVRCIYEWSRMCMTMMILRDLPHTCTCTWCYIQRDGGNEIMALPILRTREPYNLFKLNINLTMRLTLAILRWPPGMDLFNVKSRTLRVLTMAFCWWELNIATIATPLIFFYGARCRN